MKSRVETPRPKTLFEVRLKEDFYSSHFPTDLPFTTIRKSYSIEYSNIN